MTGSHVGLPQPTEPPVLESFAVVAKADAEKRDAADALMAHYAKQGKAFTRAEMLHAVDAIRALLRRRQRESQETQP